METPCSDMACIGVMLLSCMEVQLVAMLEVSMSRKVDSHERIVFKITLSVEEPMIAQ